MLSTIPSKQQLASSLGVFPSCILTCPTDCTNPALGPRSAAPHLGSAPIIWGSTMQVSGGFLGCSPHTEEVPRSKSLGTSAVDQGPHSLGDLGRPLIASQRPCPCPGQRQGASCVTCVSLAFFISKRAGQEGHVSSVDKKESHRRGRRRPWGGWLGGSQAGKLCGGGLSSQMGHD